MTKNLTQYMQAQKATGRKCFVPCIMAGDHGQGLKGLAETIAFLENLGVSAIEIGPDPVADGPVIKAAGLRSLAKGTTVAKLLAELQEIKTQIPLILMSYFNPIFQYGLERLVADLQGTAVQGLIVPDVSYEHRDFLLPELDKGDLALISLVSLTTPSDRQEMLLAEAEGLVYAVAVNGTTGERANLGQHLENLPPRSPLPVLTGFGVSSMANVKRFYQSSDGVIVGSKIVKGLNGHDESLSDFIKNAVEFGKVQGKR